jgi:hypothetical protein
LKKIFLAIAALSACVMLAGCDEDVSGAARDTRASMTAMEQGALTVGYPAIINWSEKRNLKLIYELRDNPKLVTWSYTTDMAGKLHNACDGQNSVGFPIPYAAQFTAPKAPVVRRAQYPSGYNPGGSNQGEWRTYEADQPEPNGIYMPSSADATWVLCMNPTTKEIEATYVEDHVRAYQHKIATALDN